MALLAGAAIVGGLSGGFKAYQGYKQRKAGEKAMAGLVQPEYKIPDELYANLSDAEKKQVEGLPAEQKAEFVKNIERSRQSSLKASADRKGGLLGIQESARNETDSYNNLVQMDASARKQSQLEKEAAIRSARGDLANAKNMEYGIREGQYDQQLNAAQSNIGAGMQNFMGGITQLGTTALGVAGMKYNPGGGGGATGGVGSNIPTQGQYNVANNLSKLPYGMVGAQP